MPSAYEIIPWLYAAVPIAGAAWAINLARKTRSRRPLRRFGYGCLHGAMVGIAIALVYSVLMDGHVRIAQAAVSAYGGIVMICLFHGLNAVLIGALTKLFGKEGRRATATSIVRAALLLLVGIPYILGMLLVFRTKVVHAGNPKALLKASYEPISFRATDGILLRGWWIPAALTDRTDRFGPRRPGTQTVLLCHGFDADKASQLFLVRDLVPNGYNVLAFDFRGHGESAGQFATFGDLERRDVLGAVRWLRQTRPMAAKRILGLGESSGAAALLGAAADPGEDGQSISAIALYNPYADLPSLLRRDFGGRGSLPLSRLVVAAALPVGGAPLGADLAHFAPARFAAAIWPRPLLVIGGVVDQLIDFDQSQAVFDCAMQPKYIYSIIEDSRADVLHDDQASLAVRIFFSQAKPVL